MPGRLLGQYCVACTTHMKGLVAKYRKTEDVVEILGRNIVELSRAVDVFDMKSQRAQATLAHARRIYRAITPVNLLTGIVVGISQCGKIAVLNKGDRDLHQRCTAGQNDWLCDHLERYMPDFRRWPGACGQGDEKGSSADCLEQSGGGELCRSIHMTPQAAIRCAASICPSSPEIKGPFALRQYCPAARAPAGRGPQTITMLA